MSQLLRLQHRTLVIGDKRMGEVVKEAYRAARTAFSVLLSGESGTGKELVARLIHENSERSKGPFIAVNCAAIPEGLMEAELFGFERGAFTGAMFQRIGKFELANGGTLLLDEISEMPFQLQAKLLRVLQEREIDRLGAREPIKVNVRIIATSNKSPEQLVSEGKFREDLYYRLNVIRINCPSLKGRSEAIESLVEYILKDVQRRGGNSALSLTPEALEKLVAYAWPGNVRELENVLERAILKSDSDQLTHREICFESLPLVSFKLGRTATLAETERESILNVLEANGGNRTHAAKELGISIRTLRNKLREYRQE